MKSNAAFLLILILALSVLIACNTSTDTDTETTEPAHTHTAMEWDRNADEHWQVCSCGEPVTDAAAHTMNDENLCSICQTTVEISEDGSAYVYTVNDNGDIYKLSSYYPDRSIRYEEYSVFSTDEDGNVYESTAAPSTTKRVTNTNVPITGMKIF